LAGNVGYNHVVRKEAGRPPPRNRLDALVTSYGLRLTEIAGQVRQI